MNRISSLSIFAHLYLGHPHNATPIFRDLEPTAHDWPEGAAFAVTVHRQELHRPEHWPFPGQDSATEFVAEDGWPVGFPEDKKGAYFKHSLDGNGDTGSFYRGLFHRGTPRPWKSWTQEDWEAFRSDFQHFPSTETKKAREARLDAQAGIVRRLKSALPKPSGPAD